MPSEAVNQWQPSGGGYLIPRIKNPKRTCYDETRVFQSLDLVIDNEGNKAGRFDGKITPIADIQKTHEVWDHVSPGSSTSSGVLLPNRNIESITHRVSADGKILYSQKITKSADPIQGRHRTNILDVLKTCLVVAAIISCFVAYGFIICGGSFMALPIMLGGFIAPITTASYIGYVQDKPRVDAEDADFIHRRRLAKQQPIVKGNPVDDDWTEEDQAWLRAAHAMDGLQIRASKIAQEEKALAKDGRTEVDPVVATRLSGV